MDHRCIKKKLAILTVVLSVVLEFLPSVHGSEYPLFTGNINTSLQSAAVTSSLPSGLPPARQWRQTELNPVINRPDILNKGDILTFNLFGGTGYSAHIDKVSTNINGTTTVRGRIDGFPFGNVIISTSNNNSLGTIQVPEKGEYYIIQSAPDNATHYLLDVNAARLGVLEDEPAPIPPPLTSRGLTRADLQSETLAANTLDQVTFDVMIVYTQAARDWANSTGGGIANIVAQAVAQGQLALDNSSTNVTLNLVYSGLTSYSESGNATTDLYRLTDTADNYMDEVPVLRNQYSADVVSLFIKTDNTGGIGWLLNRTSGDSEHAYSVCRVQQSGSSYTYVHEMGHNMGCGHHKLQLTEPGPGLFSYSAGWRWIGNDSGKYCSVMTYSAGSYFADGQTHTSVAYFSNPDIMYKGAATGNSTDGDNARTIRETKFAIAGYRTGTSVPAYIDIGLRLYDGTQIVSIACEKGTPTSPLRISKNGTTYGIVLVDPGDAYASGIIIQTSSGRKALRKF